MGKKAKLGLPDQRTRESRDSDYQSALEKLKSTNLGATLDVLENSILNISRADEFSLEERSDALRRLLGAILRSAKYLTPTIEKKPLWKNRTPWKEQTPFDFLAQTYFEEIASGSLTKSDVRKSDFSLYKALASPHWKAKAKAENTFSKLPTKQKSDDHAVAVLPDGITRNEIIKLLPAEFREMFRLLHVAEMRRHRALK
jgi:hypothetical protein